MNHASQDYCLADGLPVKITAAFPCEPSEPHGRQFCTWRLVLPNGKLGQEGHGDASEFPAITRDEALELAAIAAAASAEF
jgi:hypothetical protein